MSEVPVARDCHRPVKIAATGLVYTPAGRVIAHRSEHSAIEIGYRRPVRGLLICGFVVLSGCCAGDSLPVSDGAVETESCRMARPDEAGVTFAGRRFCELEPFAVDSVRGQYFDAGFPASPKVTFDTTVFTNQFEAGFASARPRGYAWVLVQGNATKEDYLVARGQGGVAITARDTGQEAVAFTTKTPSNIGSVTKFLAALAVVHAHQASQAQLPEAERVSLEHFLNVPVWELFPARWRERYDVDNGLREVRVGELLLHTSGLISVNEVSGRDDIIESLDYNATLPDISANVDSYSNINYRLLYVVIATVLEPEALLEVERELADGCDDTFDDRYLREAAAITREHLRLMLDKAPGSMPATGCNPASLDERGQPLAWAYRDDTDDHGAYYDSFEANNGYCSTTGGYFSSAEDLGAMMWAYHQNHLIDGDARQVLEGGTGMGWFVLGQAQLSFSNPDLQADTAIPSLLRKHGAQPVSDSDGEKSVYRASLWKLPFGYYVALVVNSSYSDGSGQGGRTDDVLESFSQAIVYGG